jgi:uncharacterized membrane protein YbhN (UPF0104 family)
VNRLRRALINLAQVALMAAVVYFAGTKLVASWGLVRQAAAGLSLNWWIVIASGFLVLAAYAVLIEAWRIVMGAWNAVLPFWSAVRIWTVSNLGRYVPGKVWQLGALVVMVQQRGISGVAGAGSALVNTIISGITGFAVVAVTGASVLHLPRGALVAIWAVGIAIVLAMPVALPFLGAVASRVTRRSIVLPRLAPSVVLATVVGTAIAWCIYGVAFQLLTKGLLGHAPGGTALYISVFAGSYLIGFLALFAPGGLVVREGVMQIALANAGFSTGNAIVIAVASRLWLLVLEILPGVLFILGHPIRERLRGSASRPHAR